jgi:hypothetical protein
VFACLQNIAVLSCRHHQSAIAVWRVPQNTCVITSFLRVTLRDVVTMFTFAIVSSNAWARQHKTSGVTAPARKPHAPNMPGSNSWPILMHQEKLGIIGKVGKNRECRISISGIAIILQIFSQLPDSQFFAECPFYPAGDFSSVFHLVFWSFGKFDFGRTLAELTGIFGRTYGELPQVDCVP